MKTIKNSISMKAIFSFVVAISISALVNGQFVTPNPDSPVTQIPTEEVRTGSSIVYNVAADHNAGDQYRWEVSGGTITAAAGGTISGAGNNIVEFATDVTAITVDWDQAPASAIASLTAQIQVQKLAATGSCPSQIQTLPINVWNLATAAITTGSEALCSGAAPSVVTIPVVLSGAPDGSVDGFSVDYVFTIPAGLSALDGASSPVATTGTVTTDGASVNITLPASLVNTTNGDLDFVVSLDRMNDDFSGDGTVSGTYTITVHPVPVTGDIVSASSLSRR